MTLRELLLKELNVLVTMIPEYRRDFNYSYTQMKNLNTEKAFALFVDAWTRLKSAEDRLQFINEVLGEASE